MENIKVRRRGSVDSPILKGTYSSEVAGRPAASDGKLHIESYKIGKKTIISNLGHSGSGYTIGFGTINKAIEIFQNILKEKSSSRDNRSLDIAIVGAGYIGLQTAVILKNQFPDCNITMYRKPPNNMQEPNKNSASHAAAALLSVSGFNFDVLNSKEYEELGKYTCETYEYFKKIIDDEELKNIVSYKQTYYGRSYNGKALDSGLNFYKKYSKLKQDFKGEDFENFELRVNNDFQNKGLFTLYDKTIYIDSYALMSYLQNKVEKLKIEIIEKTIESFEHDIFQDIIFDCAGIANIKDRKISIPVLSLDEEKQHSSNDIKIIPVLGHVIYYYLEESALDFAIIDEITLLPDGKEDLEVNYETHRIQIFPKNIYKDEKIISNLMIGGTNIRRDIDPLQDEQEIQLLEEIAKYYLGQASRIKNYKVIPNKSNKTLSTIPEIEENINNRNLKNSSNNWQNLVTSQKFTKCSLSKSHDSFFSNLLKASEKPESFVSASQSASASRSSRSI